MGTEYARCFKCSSKAAVPNANMHTTTLFVCTWATITYCKSAIISSLFAVTADHRYCTT